MLSDTAGFKYIRSQHPHPTSSTPHPAPRTCQVMQILPKSPWVDEKAIDISRKTCSEFLARSSFFYLFYPPTTVIKPPPHPSQKSFINPAKQCSSSFFLSQLTTGRHFVEQNPGIRWFFRFSLLSPWFLFHSFY